MGKLSFASAMSCVALALVPASASAQACAGFTDVSAASSFCPNVEWLKNRGITLGCTSTTLFCPTDSVTRLSMAAFMNRLGKALSPEVLFRETGTGTITIPAALPVTTVRCDTADTAPVAYPRSAIVTGTLNGLADGNAVAWQGFVVFSTDAGTSWNAVPGGVALRASSAAGLWSGTDPNGVVDLAPGSSYRFAIGIVRDDQVAGTTGNFADYRCLLTATVVNRNGAASPFDISLAPGPALR